MNDQEFAIEIGQKLKELAEVATRARKTGLNVMFFPSYDKPGNVEVSINRTFNFPTEQTK